MINVNQLRNGTSFEIDGEPFLVLNYEFTKMGRGKADIKVKVRNLNTNAVTVKTFISGNSVQEINLKRKKMQYLYSDVNNGVFMEPETFEQVEIDLDLISEQKAYLSDGMEVQVLFWEESDGQEKPLALELPAKLSFKVKETGPGEKGNSASNVYKSGVLENGLQVKIPLFIKQGEKVIIDTRTGEYVARG